MSGHGKKFAALAAADGADLPLEVTFLRTTRRLTAKTRKPFLLKELFEAQAFRPRPQARRA